MGQFPDPICQEGLAKLVKARKASV
jgi:hypothetical protein